MLPEPLLQNLDGLFPFDILTHAAELAAFVTDDPDDRHTRDLLVDYACHKVTAMKYRYNGLVELACFMEHRADPVYGALPRYARW